MKVALKVMIQKSEDEEPFDAFVMEFNLKLAVSLYFEDWVARVQVEDYQVDGTEIDQV